MSDAPSTIDLTALLDNHKIGRFHIQVILIGGLCCFVSGFYLVALGFIAPVAAAALNLGPGALAPAFAATGFGSICGSFICAPLADRIGRKPVIVGGLLFAAPFAFLIGTAHALPTIMIGQFFAGFALMGTVPIVLAHAGEFMPKHARVTLTMLVWIGFNLGSISTGIVAARIAAGGDWHTLFQVSGAIALAIVPLATLFLPESLEFLAEKHAATDRIAAILRKLDRSIAVPPNARFVLAEKEEHGFPVSLLFREGRARLTGLLWLMFFANMVALVFINSWLATVLVDIGIAKAIAIMIAALTNAGGIFGGIAVSELCDHHDGRRFQVLAAAYVLGGLFLAAVGFADNHAASALLTALFAGFFIMGAQNTANAVAATIYPTTMRSSGVGWAIGMGNVAQILSPLFGGFLLSLQLPATSVLAIVGAPTLVAAFAAIEIGRTTRRSASLPAATKTTPSASPGQRAI
jgi:AAHS family 4-hydroxybenzoate transporter-like MFS transporter